MGQMSDVDDLKLQVSPISSLLSESLKYWNENESSYMVYESRFEWSGFVQTADPKSAIMAAESH